MLVVEDDRRIAEVIALYLRHAGHRVFVEHDGTAALQRVSAERFDLLLLDRRLAILRGGLSMRIRRVPLANIKPGAIVDGKVLIEADLGYELDNMEGIGLHRNADGETILTLISDDNFLPFQRTLLLQFALVGD